MALNVNSLDSKTLKKQATEGVIWTTFAYGLSQILRFGSNLILTRLLFPELFGLMSLAYVFLTGLELFSDFGLNASIIQSKRGDEADFLNTAWTLQILRGIFLWICSWVVAYPAANFYNEPKLVWLIPLLGLGASFLPGLRSTSLFTIDRHLRVKTRVLFDFSGQIVGLAVILTWAWISPSIWALIAGSISTGIFTLLLSYCLDRGLYGHGKKFKHKILLDKSAFAEMFKFGKWIFLSTFIGFLSMQADRLVLARFFSLELLGIYSIAATLSSIPNDINFSISTKVLYPAYSKKVDLPRAELREKIVYYRWFLILPMAVGLGLLAGLGDLIITFLYDERYTEASWMFSVLILGTWPLILTQSIDRSLWALGKPVYWTIGSFLSALCFFIGIPLGFHSPLGDLGAIIPIALSNIPIWIVVCYGLWREKFLALSQDILATVFLLLVLSLTIFARSTLGFGTPFI